MLLQEALDAAWEEKLVRLEAYKAVHGDCNVPLRWADDKQLGKWVVHQRGRKRKLDRGEPSERMTVEGAARLTACPRVEHDSCKLTLVSINKAIQPCTLRYLASVRAGQRALSTISAMGASSRLDKTRTHKQKCAMQVSSLKIFYWLPT